MQITITFKHNLQRSVRVFSKCFQMPLLTYNGVNVPVLAMLKLILVFQAALCFIPFGV